MLKHHSICDKKILPRFGIGYDFYLGPGYKTHNSLDKKNRILTAIHERSYTCIYKVDKN